MVLQPVAIARRGELGSAARPRSRGILRRLRRHPSGVVGGMVLALVVVLVVLAHIVAPYDPLAVDPISAYQPPSLAHLLGTDDLGRDLWSRILYGGRISLLLGLIAVAIGGTAGTVLGLLAGYFRGLADAAIMLLNDILLTLPGFLLAIGIVAVLGTGIFHVMIAVGISLIPSFARVVRGSTLSAREADYVLAERVIGVSDGRIVFRHVLPNVLAPAIVLGTVGVAGAILTGAGLSFIGLGAQPPTAEWGLMVNEGRASLRTAWWISAFPGVAIMIVVIAINLVGDAFRDVLDPRLRQ